MSLRVLLEGWRDDAPDIEVRSLTQHPSRVRAGTVFIVTRNDRDIRAGGLREAIVNGCVAVLHDASFGLTGLEVPTIPVTGLGARLGELASRFWAAPSDLITVAAVAGNAERAAVTHYLAQVWQRSFGKGGMFGSRGLGAMDSLRPLNFASSDVFNLNETLAACVDDGIERVAVEISPQSLQQGRCQTLQVDLVVITGLEEKGNRPHPERRLFTEYAPTFAVVNHDDTRARRWISEFGASVEVLSFGLDPTAELSARIVTMDQDGMALHLTGPWGEADVLTDLRGEEEARNLVAAAGSLVLLGMDWVEVCRQLEFVRPATHPDLPGRIRIANDRSLERAA